LKCQRWGCHDQLWCIFIGEKQQLCPEKRSSERRIASVRDRKTAAGKDIPLINPSVSREPRLAQITDIEAGTVPYDDRKTEPFRRIVLMMRDEALKDIHDHQDSIRHDRATSAPGNDKASWLEHSIDASRQEDIRLLISRQVKILEHLDAALKRMDEGKYGLCLGCGRRISSKRLEAVPHTQLCINCKESGIR
jgi:RNA polymerase-binding protein DksA